MLNCAADVLTSGAVIDCIDAVCKDKEGRTSVAVDRDTVEMAGAISVCATIDPVESVSVNVEAAVTLSFRRSELKPMFVLIE